MERLSFDASTNYNAFEAAIHIARYLFVRDLCAGKRVLDVACGEGYGASMMATWGAKSVCGIDKSAEAIASAQANFGNRKISFLQQDIADSEVLKREDAFDLIVSFETVEHVDDPEAFLSSLRKILSQNGNIVLSCPNDAWYYKGGGANPYHKHRYTLPEFKSFSEKILGAATFWNVGTFGVGFSSIPWPNGLERGGNTDDQKLMIVNREIEESVYVPMHEDTAPNEDNVSYYLGVWGPLTKSPAVFCGYPVSMDLAGPVLHSEMAQLRSRVEEAQSSLQEASRLLEAGRQEHLRREHEYLAQVSDVRNLADQAQRLLHVELQARFQREEELQTRLRRSQFEVQEANRLLEAEQQNTRSLEDEVQHLKLEFRKLAMRRAAVEAQREHFAKMLDETRRSNEDAWRACDEARRSSEEAWRTCDELKRSNEEAWRTVEITQRILIERKKPKGLRAWRKRYFPQLSTVGRRLNVLIKGNR